MQTLQYFPFETCETIVILWLHTNAELLSSKSFVPNLPNLAKRSAHRVSARLAGAHDTDKIAKHHRSTRSRHRALQALTWMSVLRLKSSVTCAISPAEPLACLLEHPSRGYRLVLWLPNYATRDREEGPSPNEVRVDLSSTHSSFINAPHNQRLASSTVASCKDPQGHWCCTLLSES